MYYFPLTPRLQRLFASNGTTNHMTWHSEHERDGVMRHTSDSPAWNHFDRRIHVLYPKLEMLDWVCPLMDFNHLVNQANDIPLG